MIKFTKPVTIKTEEEEEPVTSKQINTSADIGGTEPVVLQQQLPPALQDKQQSSRMGGGTITAIVIGVIIVCKLVYNRFVLKSSNWFGVLGVPVYTFYNPLMWIMAFVYNTTLTLFAVSSKGTSMWNPFLINKDLVRQSEELFKSVAKQLNGGSFIDEEVSSILTNLSQL
jgi:hypothetical protein